MGAPVDKVETQFPPGVNVSYRILVSVQEGLHRGAAFVVEPLQTASIGSSSESDLVLMDEGVSGHALRLFEQDGRLAVKVFAVGVSFEGVALPLGIKAFDQPCVVLRLGGAVIKFELLRKSRRQTAAAGSFAATAARHEIATAAPARRNWVGASLVGLLMAVAFGVVASAMSTSSLRQHQQAVRTLNDVVKPLNAQGAQLVVTSDAESRPVLRGLVLDASMRDKLEQELRTAGLKADLQLHDVQQMAESLTRLARLNNHPCEARHVDAGRFTCDAGVVDAKGVAQLQALATQVPGVAGLDVHATAPEVKPVVQAQAPQLPKVEVPIVQPKWPVIRHVVISEHDSVAFDAEGHRWRVGDLIDGAKVTRIEFDKVELMHGKKRHSLSVSPASFVTGMVSKTSIPAEPTTHEISR